MVVKSNEERFFLFDDIIYLYIHQMFTMHIMQDMRTKKTQKNKENTELYRKKWETERKRICKGLRNNLRKFRNKFPEMSAWHSAVFAQNCEKPEKKNDNPRKPAISRGITCAYFQKICFQSSTNYFSFCFQLFFCVILCFLCFPEFLNVF